MSQHASSQHTVRAFDEELASLSKKINEMGGIAEAMLVETTDALMRRDRHKAEQIIKRDSELDQFQNEIEEMAVALIARRQPMANDLRQVMGTIRIAADIERVGDLLKNTAKRIVALEPTFAGLRMFSGLQHMTQLVQEQIKTVLDSFAQNNAEMARQVWSRDEQIDALHNSLFRELLTYMMEDPRMITLCTHLLFIAKNIERAGDHATNIAETVYFIETGQPLAGPRPKSDATAYMSAPSR
jgi:phosphate transport system protein